MDVPDARDTFKRVLNDKRQIFRGEPTTDQAMAFIAGFNEAWGFSLLRGFEDWLVVKLGGGFSYHWFRLLQSFVFEVRPGEELPDCTPEEDAAAAEAMFRALIDFLDDMDRREGRRDLYLAYDALRGPLR